MFNAESAWIWVGMQGLSSGRISMCGLLLMVAPGTGVFPCKGSAGLLFVCECIDLFRISHNGFIETFKHEIVVVAPTRRSFSRVLLP
jgi:hypothetical protein